jgi:hypothetical protein
MVDKNEPISTITLPSTNPPGAAVSIVGEAYDILQALRLELIGADTDSKVVMLALGLLQLARGKEIQIIEADGRGQVVNLWKSRQ